MWNRFIAYTIGDVRAALWGIFIRLVGTAIVAVWAAFVWYGIQAAGVVN
jgi:hypothetical protein